ncbi:MAG: PAS domain S-box protein [Polyangiaceae bacterium]|nr:PAS domain S-box protein [Polyangiaceae bacterium]
MDRLFAEAGVALCLIGPEGTVTQANAAWLERCGRSATDLFGSADIGLLPDEPELALAMLARARSGETVEVPRHVLRRHGRPRAWQGQVGPVALGDAFGLLVALREVTVDDGEARAAEQARRQNTIVAAMARIFHQALTCRTEEELGRVCLAVAEQATQSAFGFVSEIDERAGRLECIALSNPGWEACRMDGYAAGARRPLTLPLRGLYARPLRTHTGFFTNEPSKHPDSAGTPEGHPALTAFLGVPLEDGGRAIGVLALGNRPGGYGSGELEVAEALAPAIVQAFRSLRGGDLGHHAADSDPGLARPQPATEPEVYFTRELGSFRLSYVSPAILALRGLTVEEAAAEPFEAGFTAESWRRLEAVLGRIGTPLEEDPHAGLYEAPCRDGSVKRITLTLALLRDASGRAVALSGVCREASTERSAEAVTHEACAHYRALFEHAAIGMAEVETSSGRLVRVNERLCATLGYRPDELETRGWRELCHPDDLPAEVASLVRLTTSPAPFAREQRCLRRDGSAVWCKVSVAPLSPRGPEPRHHVVVVEDISERRRVEDELEASRAELRALAARIEAVREEEKLHLARDLHDEMGQLLCALKIDVSLLERELAAGAPGAGSSQGAPGALLDRAAEASGLTDRALQMVRRIAAELRPGVLDQLGLESALLQEARGFAERTGISCNVTVGKELPALSGELATALYRIALEGLTNVARHAEARRVDVSLVHTGDAVSLTIADDGRGIDPGARRPESLGIIGMRERAARVGGTVSVGPGARSGTILRAAVPLARMSAASPTLFDQSLYVALESFPHGVFSLRPDGSLEHWNRQLVQYTGLSVEEARDDGWHAALHPEDRPRVVELAAHVRAAETPTSEAFRLRSHEGTYRWCTIAVAPMRDHLRRVVRWLGTCIDIDDVKASADAALAQSEARFRALIEKSSDLLVLVGADGRCRFWSPSATETLGHTSADVVGRAALELVHPDDVTKGAGVLREILARPGATARFTVRVRHKDGSYRALEGIGRNLCDDPNVQAIVAHARDVTAELRLEEHLRRAQRLESLGRLAAGVAGDFDSLLGEVIDGCTALADEHAAGRAVDPERLAALRAAAEHARMLTQKLLTVARKQARSPVLLDLNALVRANAPALRPALGPNVELVIETDPNLVPTRGDPEQIAEVLASLARNARDAMPAGGKLTIGTHNAAITPAEAAEDPDLRVGEWVRLVVSDTGSGMTPEVHAHLFEPFFTTKQETGAGLGLAAVHGIVAQSGGHIHVKSEPGRGTTFQICMPRAR